MKWKPNTGLSLIELLVALGLLAIVLVGLLSTTQLGVSLLDRAQREHEFHNELATRVRLRGWLQRAQPARANDEYPFNFIGQAQEMSFVSLASTPYFPKAYSMKVTVRTNQEGLQLVLEGLDENGSSLQTLHRRLNLSTSFLFQYWDASETKPKWSSDWTDPGRVPNLVKITRLGDSTPYWPEFIVAPLLARSPS